MPAALVLAVAAGRRLRRGYPHADGDAVPRSCPYHYTDSNIDSHSWANYHAYAHTTTDGDASSHAWANCHACSGYDAYSGANCHATPDGNANADSYTYAYAYANGNTHTYANANRYT